MQTESSGNDIKPKKKNPKTNPKHVTYMPSCSSKDDAICIVPNNITHKIKICGNIISASYNHGQKYSIGAGSVPVKWRASWHLWKSSFKHDSRLLFILQWYPWYPVCLLRRGATVSCQRLPLNGSEERHHPQWLWGHLSKPPATLTCALISNTASFAYKTKYVVSSKGYIHKCS